MSPEASRQHAHDLIDQVQPVQLAVIVDLLEVAIDPVSRAIANAPVDDEPAGTAIASTPRAECSSHADFLDELAIAG